MLKSHAPAPPVESTPPVRRRRRGGRGRRSSAGLLTAQDTGNRRPDLIRAAAKLFREKGFDGTTTRDIAAAVGMRSGSPFYHFKSKQEILLAVIEEGLAGGLAKAEAAIGAGLAPREKFCALVKGHLETIHDAGSDFIPVMIYDWRRLGPEGQAKMIALKDRYDVIWQQMLHELKRAGLLRDDSSLARLWLLGGINFSAYWFRADGALSLDALADSAVEFFLRPEASS